MCLQIAKQIQLDLGLYFFKVPIANGLRALSFCSRSAYSGTVYIVHYWELIALYRQKFLLFLQVLRTQFNISAGHYCKCIINIVSINTHLPHAV